jgi:superfamily II DNA or RNA helicase
LNSRAVIKKGGPFIEVSADGAVPLHPKAYAPLESALTYMHNHFEFGGRAFDSLTEVRHTFRPERRRLYHYDGQGRLVCPKGFLFKVRDILQQMKFEVVVVDTDPPKADNIYQADWDRLFERFTLRPQQDVCLAQIDMHPGGLIDAPPAFGKTYIMGMVASIYKHAKVDIVTKRKSVVNTIADKLIRWIPSVGRVGGGKKQRDRRVTVYTADSLHHSDYTADILLADEAHELVTDRLAELLSRYWYSRNYCFTATPDTRMDNAHVRLEGLFGPCIFRMTQQEAEQLGLVTHVFVQWINVNPGVNPAQQYQSPVARKRNGVWRNQWRNQIIAETVKSFLKDGLQVLILVDTADHAVHLRHYLPEAVLCYGENAIKDDKRRRYINAGLLDADEVMTTQRRVQLRQQFERRELKCVIATGVWSTGVSFDSLNVLVRADAGDSETFNVQIPGRVCRIDPVTGKQAGILVDFVDMWDSRFQQRSNNRRRSYFKRGWTQLLADGTSWTPGSRGKRVGTQSK